MELERQQEEVPVVNGKVVKRFLSETAQQKRREVKFPVIGRKKSRFNEALRIIRNAERLMNEDQSSQDSALLDQAVDEEVAKWGSIVDATSC